MPDLINGGLETFGGLCVFNHARVLYKDKLVAGVSKFSTAVFFFWGLWNLFYYPNLDQWASFLGGLVIVAGNCTWLAMMLYYARRPRAAT